MVMRARGALRNEVLIISHGSYEAARMTDDGVFRHTSSADVMST
jgi:hypothetical protein